MGNDVSQPEVFGPDSRTVSMMDAEMRRKLGKGEKYNMKVVICGDVNTGKTCLFTKLQGLPFQEGYTPSTSLQCGHAHWSPQRSDDVVKVEVVDVPVTPSVGQGRKMTMTDAIKMSSTAKGGKVQGSFVIEELAKEHDAKEVARNAQAVLLTINPKIARSVEHARNLLVDLQPNTFVCLLALFHDEKAQWVVSRDEMNAIAASRANTYFLECSNVSNFGLQVVYKFLELPFLMMQREALLKKIELNALETQLAETELTKLLHTNANPVDVLPVASDSEDDDDTNSAHSSPKQVRSAVVTSEKKQPKSSTTSKTAATTSSRSGNSGRSVSHPLPLLEVNEETIDQSFFGSDDETPPAKAKQPPKQTQSSKKKHTPKPKVSDDDDSPRRTQIIAAPVDDEDSSSSENEAKPKENEKPTKEKSTKMSTYVTRPVLPIVEQADDDYEPLSDQPIPTQEAQLPKTQETVTKKTKSRDKQEAVEVAIVEPSIGDQDELSPVKSSDGHRRSGDQEPESSSRRSGDRERSSRRGDDTTERSSRRRDDDKERASRHRDADDERLGQQRDDIGGDNSSRRSGSSRHSKHDQTSGSSRKHRDDEEESGHRSRHSSKRDHDKTDAKVDKSGKVSSRSDKSTSAAQKKKPTTEQDELDMFYNT